MCALVTGVQTCALPICRTGGHDSYEEALTYLKSLIGDEVPQERIEAYLKNAPEMVRYLANNFDVHYRNVPKYPDYYPKNPGGKEGWRSMEPVAFDASRLGDEFRSEEHTSELQSLMRISYAVFCLKKKNKYNNYTRDNKRIINNHIYYYNPR